MAGLCNLAGSLQHGESEVFPQLSRLSLFFILVTFAVWSRQPGPGSARALQCVFFNRVPRYPISPGTPVSVDYGVCLA